MPFDWNDPIAREKILIHTARQDLTDGYVSGIAHHDTVFKALDDLNERLARIEQIVNRLTGENKGD